MSLVRVAVVGGGGHIGSSVVERFSEAGFEAWAVCRNDITGARLALAGNEVRVGSLGEPDEVKRLLGDADVVVNAALASGLPAAARRDDASILGAICSVAGAHLVHLSSVEVYGRCIDASRGSFERPRPNSAYGHRKLAIERALGRSSRGRPGRCTILRAGHVYGAGQWVSEAILSKSADGSSGLPADGSFASNAVHIANLVGLVADLASGAISPGIYNAVDPGLPSWREVADWITSAAGVPHLRPSVSTVGAETWERVRFNYQQARARRIIGEAAEWARGLPASFVLASPTSREIVRQLLHGLPVDQMERRVRLQYHATIVQRSSSLPPEPWLVSDAAPGGTAIQRDARTEADRNAQRRWWDAMSAPYSSRPANA